MFSRSARRLAVAGGLLVLALPAAAPAHPFGHHHRHRGVSCHAVQTGHASAGLTADQASALAAACDTRRTAVKAANDAFRTARTDARQARRDAVRPAVANLRTARQDRRSACRADRSSQACSDARAAYRTTVRTFRDALRSARQKLRAAVRAHNRAVRTAERTFRQTRAQILGRV